MAMMKCPHCKKDMINNVKATEFGLSTVKGDVWLLTCPNCDGYLGVVPKKD